MTQEDEAVEMMQCARCGEEADAAAEEVLCARCEEEVNREEEEALSRYSAAMTAQARWEDVRRWERAQEGLGR